MSQYAADLFLEPFMRSARQCLWMTEHRDYTWPRLMIVTKRALSCHCRQQVWILSFSWTTCFTFFFEKKNISIFPVFFGQFFTLSKKSLTTFFYYISWHLFTIVLNLFILKKCSTILSHTFWLPFNTCLLPWFPFHTIFNFSFFSKFSKPIEFLIFETL